MIKLIACDLDDTLLAHDLSISPGNRSAIQEILDNNIHFLLMTGRMPAATIPYWHSLKLTDPCGTFQGAKVIQPRNNEILYACELERASIESILRRAQQRNIHINLYDDQFVYVKEKNKWTDYYQSFAREVQFKEVGALQDYAWQSTAKILLMDEHDVLRDLHDELRKNLPPEVHMTFSKPNFLEFTHMQATKGAALSFLADSWNIHPEEVMAIGDSGNDLSMLQYAGLGVAMGNASEPIKDLSNQVTLSNEEDGVAHALRTWVLG